MITIEPAGGRIDISVYRGDDVALEVEDGTDSVLLFLTPGEAVRLSRALVKAASEALGVKV